MASKKLSTTKLSDLVKRVPPEQMQQFEKFRDKTLEYHRRVNKYPDKLPLIDWQYYRTNVRQDFVKMVEQFQIKYEELDHAFGARHEILDYTKYYAELERVTKSVKGEVQKFIDKSNSRIRVYEDEIKRLRNMIPYEFMTLEQFVTYREEKADFIPRQGKPLFWPHTESEQRVGQSNPDYDMAIKDSAEKVSAMVENTNVKVAKSKEKLGDNT